MKRRVLGLLLPAVERVSDFAATDALSGGPGFEIQADRRQPKPEPAKAASAEQWIAMPTCRDALFRYWPLVSSLALERWCDWLCRTLAMCIVARCPLCTGQREG